VILEAQLSLQLLTCQRQTCAKNCQQIYVVDEVGATGRFASPLSTWLRYLRRADASTRLPADVCHALTSEKWMLTDRAATADTVHWQPVVGGTTMYCLALSTITKRRCQNFQHCQQNLGASKFVHHRNLGCYEEHLYAKIVQMSLVNLFQWLDYP